MPLLLDAHHHASPQTNTYAVNTDQLLIIQPLIEGGVIAIGNKTYHLTLGGLYYCDNRDECQVIPVSDNYTQNIVVISKEELHHLAELLGFPKILGRIFAQPGGYYLPLKNSKSVIQIFRALQGLMTATDEYTNALAAARIIQLLNYAMYNLSR